ncbi:aminotransferase [Rhodobacterales bacterium 52_120_T64]|nr:aminotransferase [Rhodobacterales bacterium 52_120_T64]
MSRVYLDYNATTPLRPEARAAMLSAMDVLGNPSSVHAEGRAAKTVIETARRQVADATGASGADIIFTSSATEAAALALAGQGYLCAAVEHDCVTAWAADALHADKNGYVRAEDPKNTSLQQVNSETGVVHKLPEGIALSDVVQAFGKIPYAFSWSGAERAMISGHKFGAPKGVGALIVRKGVEVDARLKGGGQEMGRRSGTENVIGIAGMGAAAKAAAKDVDEGRWGAVAELRDWLEAYLADAADDIQIFGQNVDRLPNTTYFSIRGWKGETQVMQMDLAGFAVSAGSACSSGKVVGSKVLKAMGYDDDTASSAIRISMGLQTTREEVMRFADTWIEHYRRYKQRAA